MMSMIVFENENARLLFEAVKTHYPNFTLSPEEDELTEEKALMMYWAAVKTQGKVSVA
jgi:hypothetical protein